MSDKTLPCWSYPPNWASGVLESLEWKSSVATSPKGAEQRRMLRLSPRRFLEFQVLGIGNGRSNVDLAVWAAGGTDWNMPLWWDFAKLTADAAGSATAIFMNTAFSEFEAGGLAFIQGPDDQVFDVVEIVSVAADRLNLVAPGTSRAWKTGTKVYPMRQVELTDQPQVTRHSDGVASYQVSFMATEKNVFQAVAPSETYLGYKVYRASPDEAGSMTVQWSRMLVECDNGSGVPYRVDTARYGFAHQQHQFFVHGKQEHLDFRKLLYWFRGRVRPAWVPTFSIDMRLTAPVSSLATALTIEKVGVAAYVHFDVDPAHPEYAYPGRRHIMIHLRDGTAVFALMNNAVDNGDGTETITLSAPTGVAIAPADIKRISFIALMRLDQDRVEINHLTDAAGVSQSTVVWVSTPENRQADSWSVDDWAGIMTSETCTLCTPPTFGVENNLYTTNNDYNPITGEMWVSSYVWSGSSGPTGIAKRWTAGSLEILGTVDAANSDVTVQAIQGSTAFIWTWDVARGVVWTVWTLRVGGVVGSYILKIDATTGAVLKCVKPTGTGVSTWNAKSNRLHLDATGQLWLLCVNSTSDTYVHAIDATTLMPTASYHSAGVYMWDIGGIQNMNAANDAAGNLYFIARNGGGDKVYKFNVSTHAFSVFYTAPSGDFPNVLVTDTSRDQIVVALQSTPRFQRLDASGTVVGEVNWPTYQPFDNDDPKLAYDASNDVLWGLTDAIGSGTGRITGLHVGSNTAYGYFDADLNGPTIRYLFYGLNVPGPGRPGALYVSGQVDDGTFDYGLWKIPLCNVVRGTPP